MVLVQVEQKAQYSCQKYSFHNYQISCAIINLLFYSRNPSPLLLTIRFTYNSPLTANVKLTTIVGLSEITLREGGVTEIADKHPAPSVSPTNAVRAQGNAKRMHARTMRARSVCAIHPRAMTFIGNL